MPNDLTDWVMSRLDADESLSEAAGYLVLAALEGDESLDQQLTQSGAVVMRSGTSEATVAGGPQAGTFLRSLTVQGFRGVGPQAQLELAAAPGLTVVSGRNGSGKSSLAEALELLLTGSTYRWSKKTAAWKDTWRNLHAGDGCRISATFVREGTPESTLTTSWADTETDVEQRTTSGQAHGQKKVTGSDPFRWAGDLQTYRPILSYDEFGSVLAEGPSKLYDALASVLGVEELTDALKRLTARHKELKAPATALASERKSLVTAAAGVPDERAEAVEKMLKKTSPDLDAVRALVTGATAPDDGPLAHLRALVNLVGPDLEVAARRAEALRSAVASMAEVAEEGSARRSDRLAIRRTALAAHTQHGDMSCPVCAGGFLDDSWAAETLRHVEREEEELRALSDAAVALDSARRTARATVTGRPTALDTAPTTSTSEAVELARAAWDTLVQLPPKDLQLADHLERTTHDLDEALAMLRAAANADIEARDDRWSPLATRVASWCEKADEVAAAAELRADLAAAEKWLKDNDRDLKNERLAPISDGARDAWARLRQESNVDLGQLELTGSGTRRKLEITAAVDGETTDALPVLSQGELHALALSLFLPRARSAASPFRFLVLDDPVQAMDPAKVDGLVELLGEIAETRQVIVFSHDDRLATAVRRSRFDARLVEVTRGTGSQVSLREVADPASRYLDDARALCRDDGLPAETLRRTLPGLLRMALESAARERYFTERLRAGAVLTDVEQTWEDHHLTAQRVSLAIYDEVRPLDSWLTAPYRKRGLGCATSALHQGLHSSTNPSDAVHDVNRMLDDVRIGAK